MVRAVVRRSYAHMRTHSFGAIGVVRAWQPLAGWPRRCRTETPCLLLCCLLLLLLGGRTADGLDGSNLRCRSASSLSPCGERSDTEGEGSGWMRLLPTLPALPSCPCGVMALAAKNGRGRVSRSHIQLHVSRERSTSNQSSESRGTKVHR